MKSKSWKNITLAVMYVAFTCVALSSQANATPPKTQGGKCNGVLNCNDVELTDESVNNDNTVKNSNYIKSGAEADSTAVGTGLGIGTGVGYGGDGGAGLGVAVSGVGDSGNSSNYVKNNSDSDSRSYSNAEGGDSRSYSGSDSRSGVVGSGNSGSNSGASIEDSSTTSVDASDNSSYSSSYRYEEAAKSAAILFGQVCSDVTNIQGVKFGISSSKQSTFCMRLTVAQGFYAAAAMLNCADAESVGKGSEYIRSPSASQCELDQRGLYLEGTTELRAASALVDAKKRGWIHKLWNTVVW